MKTTTTLILFTFALCCAAHVRAGLYHTETKLTARYADSLDYFGYSVGISGNTAIVGAYKDEAGSAYLFDVTTGMQLAKLDQRGYRRYDYFGVSVGINGNTAIVGADGDDERGSSSGAAYLFDVATGNLLFKLKASDAATEDNFGSSVAISGNRAIVGAHLDDDKGSSSGSVYLFDVTTGQQLFKLNASDAAAGDQFGKSVAISGNKAIVGSWCDGASCSGSAYLFDVTTGMQIAKLTANDGAAADRFGNSVAISGNIAIVGAVLNDDGGNSSGSAYVFDVSTGVQLYKLTASDDAAGDRFGQSVAISGNTAIIGAYQSDGPTNLSGSAYLFDVTTGSQIAKLTASDADTFDNFGFSVAISGNKAIVGAYGDDDDGLASGSAYLFTPEPSSLVLSLIALMGAITRRR
jgi:outer membrane protein assembly factor BamB